MKRIFFGILLFSVLGYWNLQAQAASLQLSIKQAQDYAIEHNLNLQNSSLEIQKAEAQSWQVLASMLPQVSAGFDYQNYCGYKMNLMGMSIPMNPVGTLGVTASFAVSGAQVVNAMLVDLAVNMADLKVKKDEQAIKSQVRQIYISILAMEQTMSLLDSSLLNLKKLYDIAEEAVKLGAAEQTASDQISVQVAAMHNTINSTKRSIEVLYNSLRLQMGSEVNDAIVLTDDLKTLLQIDVIKQLLDIQFDISNNYNYQLLLRNVELADKQITMAKVAYLPTLSAFYKYSYRTYFGASEGMNMTPPNLVGLSLNIPIWASGARMKKVAEAEISKQIVDNTLKNTQNALMIQYKQLHYNLTSALEDFELQNNNIEVTQRVFESILNKYKYGTASSMDVTTASSNLIAAHSTYVKSLLALFNAQIALEDLLNKYI